MYWIDIVVAVGCITVSMSHECFINKIKFNQCVFKQPAFVRDSSFSIAALLTFTKTNPASGASVSASNESTRTKCVRPGVHVHLSARMRR